MKKWQIRYWSGNQGKNPIEKWLDKLTNEEFKSVAKELKMLEEAGTELKLPHSRALGKGLFELRERRYNFRIYYGFYAKKIIIILATGSKAKQESDIKLARERLSKIEK